MIEYKAWDYVEGKCNTPLTTCRGCEHKYNDKDKVNCPVCQQKRGLCKNAPSRGSKWCRFHGGHALSGFSHPNSLAARYVGENTPSRYLDRYMTYLDDKDVLNNEPSIAILDSRIEELYNRIDKRESGKLWNDLRGALEKKRLAFGLPKSDKRRINKIRDAEAEINLLIDDGYNETLLWEEINRLIDLRRKVSDSEIKRRKAAQDSISRDKMEAVIGSLIALILQNVKDRSLVNKLMKSIKGVEEQHDLPTNMEVYDPLSDPELLKLMNRI